MNTVIYCAVTGVITAILGAGFIALFAQSAWREADDARRQLDAVRVDRDAAYARIDELGDQNEQLRNQVDELGEALEADTDELIRYRMACLAHGIDPGELAEVDEDAMERDAPNQMLWDNEWEDSDELLRDAFNPFKPIGGEPAGAAGEPA